MKKNLKKLALWSFILSVVTFVITYLICHYVTADGQITAVWQKQAGKPMVTMWFGQLGTMFLFGSIFSAVAGGILCGGREK